MNKLQFIRPYNSNYTNNISILKLWAETVMGRNSMGRNGHGPIWLGPIWLWAEITSDQTSYPVKLLFTKMGNSGLSHLVFITATVLF